MRILLYVTTHLSTQHLKYLTNCWNTTTRHPVLATSDTLFFAPHNKWSTLQKLFPNAMYTSPQPNRQGYQEGAIDAMINKDAQKIFQNYDWVVRLNPDVVIYSFARIHEHMTDDLDALIGTCAFHNRAMTDFVVFRPRILNTSLTKPLSCRYYPPGTNAECDMTNLLQNATYANRTKSLYRTPGGRCRTRWKNVVMHKHEGC